MGDCNVAGGYVSTKSEICSKCIGKSWFVEMERNGCNICDYNNLGAMPEMIEVEKKDLPVIEVDGEKYRDVTSILFIDGKHKKKYLTQLEEIEREKARNKRIRYEIRKSDVKRREKARARREEKIVMERKTSEPTREEVERISKLLYEGYSVRKIMRKVRISQNYYYKIVEAGKKMGISCERRTEPNEKEIRKISKMLEGGYTISMILGNMGITKHFYNKAMEEAEKLGITYRAISAHYTPEDDEIIVKGLKDGLTRKEIGDKLGRKEKAINSRIRRLRIKGVIDWEI